MRSRALTITLISLGVFAVVLGMRELRLLQGFELLVNDQYVRYAARSGEKSPRVVIVDAQLTVSLPPSTTAQTGMDAITQLIESYVSRKARPRAFKRMASSVRSSMRYSTTSWLRVQARLG